MFVVNMEFGFDIAREAIEPREAQPLPEDGATIAVAAQRGWQSTGFLLEQGGKYRIQASGRVQLADQPKVWWSEANGVTIRYYNGAPLGILLAAIVDEQQGASGAVSMVNADIIGLGLEAPVERSGTLFLRINDSPAELADNDGSLEVRITRVE